jgi:hypothetical protein
MHRVDGGCHCGNISLELELSRLPNTYSPRACDCTFCTKHGAAYISDPQGHLRIRVRQGEHSRMYRQGSGMAECLLCVNCGVLVGVLYRDRDNVYAAVNVKATDRPTDFGAEQTVAPRTLAESDKVSRWKSLWFSKVIVDTATAD